jgi:hypothetical protein
MPEALALRACWTGPRYQHGHPLLVSHGVGQLPAQPILVLCSLVPASYNVDVIRACALLHD